MFTDEELLEKLIDEVEMRPVLFNKMCKEYSDINFKKSKWDEVTMKLVGIVKWGEMSTEERTNACKEVQKRWLNLRNCFSRELRLQRETKSGQSTKKRRTYIYFQRLMFLLPTIDPRETTSNISNDSEDGEETHYSNTEQMCPSRPSPNSNKWFEQSLLNVLERKMNKEQNKIVIDEDHNFALSLVPMLQRLSVYNKIDAKMQILNIFKEKCSPKPEMRKIRIINQKIISPPVKSPGPSQTQHTVPENQTQGPYQSHSPPPANSPGSSQIQQALVKDRQTNDSVHNYFSNYFVDDYE